MCIRDRARDGALTRALKKPSLVSADCKKAAAEVMNRLQNYNKGTSTRLTIGGKQVAFSYLYFMTQNAYRSLGLSATYRTVSYTHLLCYHSELSTFGACRLCTVEDDRGKTFASCSEEPRDGICLLYTSCD